MEQVLDRWSLVHFTFWFSVAPGLLLIGLTSNWRWIVVLAGIVTWELLEIGLEQSGRLAAETWINRWVSDPCVSVFGALVGAWWIERSL